MTIRIKFISFMFICVFCAGCHRDVKREVEQPVSEMQVRIQGVIEGGEGSEVILEEMGAREFIPLDTVTCDERGAFEILFKPEEVAFYVLRKGSSGYITLLAEPGESIRLTTSSDGRGDYRVEGSAGSQLLMVLAAEHKRTLDELGIITRRNMELAQSPGYADIKMDLDRRFDSITAQFRNYSLDFIHGNQGSLAILVALYNLYGQGLPVFDPVNDLDVYLFVDSVLMAGYPEFEAVSLLHAQVTSARAALEEEVPGPSVGEIAPDFVSSRPDGEQVALTDLRGNYVLLQFWAAWSKPSREENSYLSAAWERFGTRPFRILQVSFDNDRELWLRAITEDHLIWDQASDLKRWETIVADLYQVEKIPSNYLIGTGGEIMGKELYGEALIEQLEAIFAHD